MGKYIRTLNLLVLIGVSAAVNAQKVTDVQNVSKLAPATIRVDGKDLEWNNIFLANNKRTSIRYSMTNDNRNLYLVIKSEDIANNSKIMAGGITLSINTNDNKKEKESITLTYPLVNRANFRNAMGGGRRMGGVMGMGGRGAPLDAKKRDSMMVSMQKMQLATVKEIKINGFKTTTDTLISIYNEFGISAVANIDKDNVFFYELKIPLEALGLSTDPPKEFAYNIKLNGLQMTGLDGGGFGNGGGGGRGFGGGGGRGFGGGGGRGFGGGGSGGGQGGIDFQALMSPTDFWGKYTLAK